MTPIWLTTPVLKQQPSHLYSSLSLFPLYTLRPWIGVGFIPHHLQEMFMLNSDEIHSYNIYIPTLLN